MSKQVLFISHEATPTGAPIVFLDFLKWFNTNSDIPFELLLARGGSIESKFEQLGSPFIFEPDFLIEKDTTISKLINRTINIPIGTIYLWKLKQEIARKEIGLIFSNTITNSKVLKFLSFLNCPIICLVHELEWIINQCCTKAEIELIRQHTHHFIAVSAAVKANLIHNFQIPEEKISVIHEFSPAEYHLTHREPKTRQEICQSLDIPENAKIICASGTIDWRKGADLFIQLARSIHTKKLEKPIYLLWVGGAGKRMFLSQIKHDLKQFGLEKYVRFPRHEIESIGLFSCL